MCQKNAQVCEDIIERQTSVYLSTQFPILAKDMYVLYMYRYTCYLSNVIFYSQRFVNFTKKCSVPRPPKVIT